MILTYLIEKEMIALPMTKYKHAIKSLIGDTVVVI